MAHAAWCPIDREFLILRAEHHHPSDHEQCFMPGNGMAGVGPVLLVPLVQRASTLSDVRRSDGVSPAVQLV